MNYPESLFYKLHHKVDFKSILRSDECKLLSCWLDFGEPTLSCQHHRLANSGSILKYANTTFPMELTQPYIDAALLNHGHQYNCRIMGVKGKEWLDVGIVKHSPLFHLEGSINITLRPEIAKMTNAYIEGHIKHHTTSFKARERLITNLTDSIKYLNQNTWYLNDTLPGIRNDTVKRGINEIITKLLTSRKQYNNRIRASKKSFGSAPF